MCHPYQESSAKKPSSPKRSEGVHHGGDHSRLGPHGLLGLMVVVTVVVPVAAMAARTARTSCWVVVHNAKS